MIRDRDAIFGNQFRHRVQGLGIEEISSHLPFHLVPADHKWFRNLAVLERLVLALRPYRSGLLSVLKAVRRSALKKIRHIRKRVKRGG